jgi:monofunctional biosynthetic peptidoglycan transglycosylase
MTINIDPDGSQRREVVQEARRATGRQTRRRGLRLGGIARRLFRALLALVVTTVLVVAALRFLPPPTSAFMLRERIAASIEPDGGRELRQEWVDWSRISPHAVLAVISAEDQRFREHDGFDVGAIRQALTAHRSGKRLRGASTISQQVAKNLFLWPGRSLVRKGLEAYFTVLIETLWPKRRILEVYLNIAQFGAGIYGIEAASRTLFAKGAEDITAAEAALLAAVLPNPVKLDAGNPSRYVRDRQAWILRQMRQLGGLDHLAGL